MVSISQSLIRRFQCPLLFLLVLSSHLHQTQSWDATIATPESFQVAKATVVPDCTIVYNFNSASSTTPLLKGGATHDVTSRPEPTFGIVTMTGNGGYIDLPDLNFGGPQFTIRMWIQTQTAGKPYETYLSFGNRVSGVLADGIKLYRCETRKDLCVAISDSAGQPSVAVGEKVLVDDIWQELVLTFSDGSLVFYLNSVQVATAEVTQPPKVLRSENRIGKGENTDPTFTGIIDVLGIWPVVALSPTQVLAMYIIKTVKKCDADNGNCDLMTKCLPGTNPWGKPTCSPCPTGYTNTATDGTSLCRDVDECVTVANACSDLSTCINTVGSFKCGPCATGYSGDGKGSSGCKDVDECATNNGGCASGRKCINSVGSFSCSGCPSGYTLSGSVCEDINECATNNGGCDLLSRCENTPGSFTCGTCPNGYTKSSGGVCVDIDECAMNNGACDLRTRCTNTAGSRTCSQCPRGYTGTGESGCSDIDECKTNRGGCDPRTTCINTPGGRECGACPSGFIGSGELGCTDIDECVSKNGGCDIRVTCMNTAGSRTCGACPADWDGDGEYGCIPPNPCKRNNGGCHELTQCIRVGDSRVCSDCPAGYKGNGMNGCLAIDVCTVVTNGGCDPRTSCIPDPRTDPTKRTAKGRTCGPCPTGMIGDGETGCREDNRFVTISKYNISALADTEAVVALDDMTRNNALLFDRQGKEIVKSILKKLITYRGLETVKAALKDASGGRIALLEMAAEFHPHVKDMNSEQRDVLLERMDEHIEQYHDHRQYDNHDGSLQPL